MKNELIKNKFQNKQIYLLKVEFIFYRKWVSKNELQNKQVYKQVYLLMMQYL